MWTNYFCWCLLSHAPLSSAIARHTRPFEQKLENTTHYDELGAAWPSALGVPTCFRTNTSRNPYNGTRRYSRRPKSFQLRHLWLVRRWLLQFNDAKYVADKCYGWMRASVVRSVICEGWCCLLFWVSLRMSSFLLLFDCGGHHTHFVITFQLVISYCKPLPVFLIIGCKTMGHFG